TRLLFALDAERIDDAADALGILIYKLLEVIAAQEDRHPAEFFAGSLPRRGFSSGANDFNQSIALGGGDSRCAEDASPVGQLYVDALLFQCVKSFNARRAGYGKRAHAPAFNLLGKFADAGNAGGHVAADDRGNRFAAALVGYVVDLTGINACGLGDQTNQNMIRAACGAAAPGNAAWISFEGFD